MRTWIAFHIYWMIVCGIVSAALISKYLYNYLCILMATNYAFYLIGLFFIWINLSTAIYIAGVRVADMILNATIQAKNENSILYEAITVGIVSTTALGAFLGFDA